MDNTEIRKYSKYSHLCNEYKPFVKNGIIYKKCTNDKCGIVKPITDFYKDKKYGHSNQCKKCSDSRKKREKSGIYSTRSKKPVIFENRNGEIFKSCCRCREIKHNSEFNKKQRNKYGISDNCKLCVKEVYKIEKKEPNYRKIKNEIGARYVRNRRKRDISFRILGSCRARMKAALKGRSKTERTMELIGCSGDFFKTYLESLWQNGMNWNNYGKGYGKWNIDHIVCLELFDMTDYKQRCAGFNYKNCMPMWDDENFEKSDSINDKRARDMSKIEKLNYLKSLGFDFSE